MEIKVKFLAETPDSTLSELYIDGKKAGIYVLEDGYRKTKVPKFTRIPKGTYNLIAVRSGTKYESYSTRYGHQFALLFESVPKFTGIMIHIGNEISDTDGCLLVGTKKTTPKDLAKGVFTVGSSVDAYKKLYALLAPIFYDATKKKLTGAKVKIEVDRTGSANNK